MTALNTLFEQFGLLLDAPNSVQKMRELILQLAVQGKLVPQDPKDEPASELLKKIKAEKEVLIKEGKIRKEKPLPSTQPDDPLYKLPNGWDWVRLGEILSFEYGKGLKKEERVDSGDFPVFGSNGIVGYNNSFLTDKPAIIIGRKGSAGALNLSYEPSWTTDVAYYCVPLEGLNIEYALIALKTSKLDKLGKGIKPGINRNEAYLRVLPIPPIVEQKRIVAKVDQLMKLCDELEAKQQKAAKNRIALNDIALDKLATSDNSDFSNHWAFVHDNFDLLYSVPENVTKLRQTILQLAVQGKLIPQDPKDEPSSELLKKIKTGKERLIKGKKIKKEKPLPPIQSDEIPYELPNGWDWVRLGDIIKISSGDGLTSKQMVADGDIPVYGGNGITGYHNKWNVQKPTIVIGRVGFYCGSVHMTEEKAWITDNAFITFFSEVYIFPAFLVWLLKGTNLKERESATAQPVISGRKVYPLVVGLPPLPEQKRIVAKVDQLMKLCDDLESRLHQSQKDSKMLIQAVLQEAFG